MGKSYSIKLFARPSVVEGAARLWDFGATLQQYNESKSEKEADINALNSDWQAVGDDISVAIEKYEKE